MQVVKYEYFELFTASWYPIVLMYHNLTTHLLMDIWITSYYYYK